MTHQFTLRDFCAPGDRYTNFATGERIIIQDDNPWKGHAMIYRFTDTARPGEHLDLKLKRSEWYDLDSPEIDEDNITEFLNWWSDPRGRGFHEMEDGGYIVLVEATSGEPDIGIWSPGLKDSDCWELGDFPFSRALSYTPLPEDFDDIVEEQGWNVDSVSMIRGSYINNPEGAATLAEFARRIADEENYG